MWFPLKLPFLEVPKGEMEEPLRISLLIAVQVPLFPSFDTSETRGICLEILNELVRSRCNSSLEAGLCRCEVRQKPHGPLHIPSEQSIFGRNPFAFKESHIETSCSRKTIHPIACNLLRKGKWRAHGREPSETNSPLSWIGNRFRAPDCCLALAIESLPVWASTKATQTPAEKHVQSLPTECLSTARLLVSAFGCFLELDRRILSPNQDMSYWRPLPNTCALKATRLAIHPKGCL